MLFGWKTLLLYELVAKYAIVCTQIIVNLICSLFLYRIYERYESDDEPLHHVDVKNNRPLPPSPIPDHAPPTPLSAPQGLTLLHGPTPKPPGTMEYSKGSASALMGLKVLSEIILSSLVLLCTVFSKLSLVGLTDDLNDITRLVKNGSGSDPVTISRAVALYWQFLVILLIPNFITFLRCLLFGCLGKSSQSFPFPTKMALFVVSM